MDISHLLCFYEQIIWEIVCFRHQMSGLNCSYSLESVRKSSSQRLKRLQKEVPQIAGVPLERTDLNNWSPFNHSVTCPVIISDEGTRPSFRNVVLKKELKTVDSIQNSNHVHSMPFPSNVSDVSSAG